MAVSVITAEAGASLIPALLRFVLESWSGYWAGMALGWFEAGIPGTDLINTLAGLEDSPTSRDSSDIERCGCGTRQ
ncbi:hypothetical protein BL253_24515 [Pseudofrankia asymbiotica]|uniref:Uncharacterized protein n=1 Tax=Pseudofrankia asymbiotica TaxID=1834516 RepID=A0A1V2I5R7_9ACTN|nr:hypothetical protein BL253_24515 [Pseudofrankia asymbiotica]